MESALYSEERGDFSLLSYITALESEGELVRCSEPTPLRNVAKVIASVDKATLIERPIGYDIPILANAMASRRQFAVAFGVPEDGIIAEMTARSTRIVPPKRVDTGPVKEVIRVGEEADLTRLPVYLQHQFDGAPYISAALDVSRHPETGRYNIGVRRLMLRGPRETGVDVVSPTDLRAYYRRAREIGRPFEIAFVVGAHPLDYMATQMKTETDNELEVMGGFRGEPVPVTKCETIDVEVPADAEIILEGHLEGDWTEIEGPFGEYTGCYGAVHINPVFRVSAITHRASPIFETATIGGKKLHFTDQAGMLEIRTEALVWESLTRAVAEPVAVYCPPEATGLHHARIAIRSRDPGDGRNALAAALGSNADIKMALVVDEDIDVFDDQRVEWALATRFQADRDLVVVPGMRTLPLDPSLPPHEGSKVVTTKMGLDATRPFNRPSHAFGAPDVPFADEEAEYPGRGVSRVKDVAELAERVAEVAAKGVRFIDLLKALPGVHEGDIVLAIGLLRERQVIEMDTDGRYWTKSG